MRSVAHLAVIGIILASAPIRAAAADDSSKTKTVAPDPNERVCENVVQTGSRLATKRFCGTRAEMEARKKQDRDVVDDAQRQAAAPCQAILTHTGAPNCG